MSVTTVPPVNITSNPPEPRSPFHGVTLSPERVNYLLGEYRRKLAEPHPEPARRYFERCVDDLVDYPPASIAA